MIRCCSEWDSHYKCELKKIMTFLRKGRWFLKESYDSIDFTKSFDAIWKAIYISVFEDFEGQELVDNLFIRESNTHYYFNAIIESYYEEEEDKQIAYFREMVVAKNFSEFYFIDKNRVDKWFNDSSGTHFETFECDDLILDSSDDEVVINDLISRLNEYSGLSNTSKNAKAMTVFEFWTLLNTLKDTIRTGWMRSNVSKERIESVAEHVYSTNNLAIAMASQFGYNVDLFRVVFMIAIHEIGEAVIGDIAVPEQGADKADLERQAVVDIINGLISKDLILSLFDEFEARKTDEAKFAYQCDKVDCDLQCGAYQGFVNDEDWSNKWIEYDINKYKYDENFEAVARLAMKKKED